MMRLNVVVSLAGMARYIIETRMVVEIVGAPAVNNLKFNFQKVLAEQHDRREWWGMHVR